MIIRGNLSSGFIQNGNSCMLATYGMGARYFTGIGINDFFEAYCLHNSLPPSPNAETAYNGHFHPNASRINGYQIILDLHNHSQVAQFANARTRFDVEYLPDGKCSHADTMKILNDEESCLCAACIVTELNGRPKGVHSVLFAIDMQGMYYIDTSQLHNGLFAVSSWPCDVSIGNLCRYPNLGSRDGLLLRRKT